MSEVTEKKRAYTTAKSRVAAIYDRYQRTPTTNELRAIDELPLQSVSELNDRSEKGKRIWLLLEKSERIRDVSLLEEAGKLLWEQVMSPPTSRIDSSSSYSKEASVDRSSSAQVISSRNFEDFDTSAPNSQGGYSRDAKLSEENMLHENKDGGTANTEENLSTIICPIDQQNTW